MAENNECTDCSGANPCTECEETALKMEIQRSEQNLYSESVDLMEPVSSVVEGDNEEEEIMVNEDTVDTQPQIVIQQMQPPVDQIVYPTQTNEPQSSGSPKPDKDPELRTLNEGDKLTSKWWFWLIILAVLILLVIGAVKLFKK